MLNIFRSLLKSLCRLWYIFDIHCYQFILILSKPLRTTLRVCDRFSVSTEYNMYHLYCFAILLLYCCLPICFYHMRWPLNNINHTVVYWSSFCTILCWNLVFVFFIFSLLFLLFALIYLYKYNDILAMVTKTTTKRQKWLKDV